jgi:hypothetical protein
MTLRIAAYRYLIRGDGSQFPLKEVNYVCLERPRASNRSFVGYRMEQQNSLTSSCSALVQTA